MSTLSKTHLWVRRLLIVGNSVLVVFVFLSFGREAIRQHEIKKQIETLQADADALTNRQKELEQWHTAYLTQTDVEREARLKFGLKKPGEQVMIVQTPEEDTSQRISDNVLQSLPASESNPHKWWRYFFHPKP